MKPGVLLKDIKFQTLSSPDASRPGDMIQYVNARITSIPFIVAYAVFINLNLSVALIICFSLPWSHSITLFRYFICRGIISINQLWHLPALRIIKAATWGEIKIDGTAFAVNCAVQIIQSAVIFYINVIQIPREKTTFIVNVTGKI